MFNGLVAQSGHNTTKKRNIVLSKRKQTTYPAQFVELFLEDFFILRYFDQLFGFVFNL